MPVVLEDIERKVTVRWIGEFVGVAVAVFAPVSIVVWLTEIHPNGPLLLGAIVFVSALIPVSKRLPIRKREVLRLHDNGELEVLLSKDPHQAVGSWWRHRVAINGEALDRIRFAQSQAQTSLPDIRWWYWVRFESGPKSLDTWIPDGLETTVPEAMRRLEAELGVPVVQEEEIGIRRAHQYRREQKKQTIPEQEWP